MFYLNCRRSQQKMSLSDKIFHNAYGPEKARNMNILKTEDVREAVRELIRKNEECVIQQRPMLFGEIKEIFGEKLI